MYLTRSEYDRGVNTFSPEGRLFQVSIVLVRYNIVPAHFTRTVVMNVTATALQVSSVIERMMPSLSHHTTQNSSIYIPLHML